MGATKAEWCDFVIYTFVGMSFERIKFDAQFFEHKQVQARRILFQQFLRKSCRLHVGPTVHSPLNDVLIRFRKHPYVLITDISKICTEQLA